VNGTLGRETSGEVVLLPRLRAALEQLNPSLPGDAFAAAIDELTRDRSAMSLAAANREVYLLLKEGIRVSVPNKSVAGKGSSACACWTGTIPQRTISCSSASSASLGRSIPADRI